MYKFGVVFPGQGSQKQGMLTELADARPIIADTFREASGVLGFDLLDVVRDNPEGRLDETHITQPALLTASVALWRLWLEEKGPLPELLAGHSLGEYSALVCAGVIGFEQAVDVVHKRGRYMQDAVPAGTGAMAAIIGLEDDVIAKICADAGQGDEIVTPANFNAPGQTVIAGSAAAVERAVTALKEAGAKRALPLNVSVPSHCSLMREAADRLGQDLAQLTFKRPEIPVVQNINGHVSKDPDTIRENLLKQLYMPVQWVDSIGCMRDFGIGKVVECGPGKVLSGLIRRIERNMDCYTIEDGDSLAAAREAIQQG